LPAYIRLLFYLELLFFIFVSATLDNNTLATTTTTVRDLNISVLTKI